jgi:CDP-ribitol ribitolphosphotransferase
VYRKATEQPVVQGKVIFLENRGQDMPDAFKVLWDELNKRPRFMTQFISLGDGRVSYVEFVKGAVSFIEEAATAEFIILCDYSNIVSCVPLRSETTVIQLWHGCGAFKKWGVSTVDLIFGLTREELMRHPNYKNLSLVTVSSSEVEWAYREAMALEDTPEVVQALGVSRTDMFFDEAYLQASRAHVEEVVPACKGKKILLYAPTFRGRVAEAEGPNELDIEALKNALGNEWVLIIKHHPFVKQLPVVPETCRDFASDVTRDLEINELLCVADACISDYSSLVFEYSLFEKPLIFFAFDKAEYDDWRGFYYNYDELTPGPVCTTTQEIIDYVRSLDEGFDPSEVRAFREKFMSACDGHATERIIDFMMNQRLS